MFTLEYVFQSYLESIVEEKSRQYFSININMYYLAVLYKIMDKMSIYPPR